MDEKDRELQELRRQVESIKVEPVRRGQWLSPFCPNCGAKMDLGGHQKGGRG